METSCRASRRKRSNTSSNTSISRRPAIYNRDQRLTERTKMMQFWADKIDKLREEQGDNPFGFPISRLSEAVQASTTRWKRSTYLDSSRHWSDRTSTNLRRPTVVVAISPAPISSYSFVRPEARSCASLSDVQVRRCANGILVSVGGILSLPPSTSHAGLLSSVAGQKP